MVTKQTNLDMANSIGATPLHVVAYLGYETIVKSLLNAGARINPRCNKGKAPLDYARAAGRSRVVALLQEHGAY